MNDILDNSILELRRGVVIMAALSTLQNEGYGYSVLKQLAGNGLEVDQGTLYPLLRRLETQGLLKSNWRIEAARPRRYYQTSSEGLKMLQRLMEEWKQITRAVEIITSLKPENPAGGE
jgi:DNA-binding PadR family transcriptional regulator